MAKHYTAKKKPCERCGKEYEPRSNSAKLCDPCRAMAKSEREAIYKGKLKAEAASTGKTIGGHKAQPSEPPIKKIKLVTIPSLKGNAPSKGNENGVIYSLILAYNEHLQEMTNICAALRTMERAGIITAPPELAEMEARL